MTSHDAQKTKTGKSAAQQFQIAWCRISKTVCLPQPREEIVQIPAHQFETEHLVTRYLCVHDGAHIRGVINSRINSELLDIAGFRLRQKKLFRHACSAGVAQSVAEQIAPRTRNCANHITTPRVPQLMKQTSHLYTSRFRTFSALSSMNWRRGSTTSPIRIVNILSASTALSSFKSTFNNLRFSGFIVVSNHSLAFISPRPLKRLICTPRRPISKIFSRISGIENNGWVSAFSPSPSINSKIGRSLAA